MLKREYKLLHLIQGNGPQPSGQPVVSKLNTGLSVPQLALFIRLMIDAKIIDETNQSPLLKNIAAIVSTPKTAVISSESLRVNYYTPTNAAKNIVKEYLISMVNRLKDY